MVGYGARYSFSFFDSIKNTVPDFKSVAGKAVFYFKNTASEITSECLFWNEELRCTQSSFLVSRIQRRNLHPIVLFGVGELCCMQSRFFVSRILPLSLHPIVWFGVANSVACTAVFIFKNTASELTSNVWFGVGELCCMLSGFLVSRILPLSLHPIVWFGVGNSVACKAALSFKNTAS
jgi:hypothetical protein